MKQEAGYVTFPVEYYLLTEARNGPLGEPQWKGLFMYKGKVSTSGRAKCRAVTRKSKLVLCSLKCTTVHSIPSFLTSGKDVVRSHLSSHWLPRQEDSNGKVFHPRSLY